MTQFSYAICAGPRDRFAPDAFANQIGRQLPLRLGGRGYGLVTILNAEVSPDGSHVEVTAETVNHEAGDLIDALANNDLFAVKMDPDNSAIEISAKPAHRNDDT